MAIKVFNPLDRIIIKEQFEHNYINITKNISSNKLKNLKMSKLSYNFYPYHVFYNDHILNNLENFSQILTISFAEFYKLYNKFFEVANEIVKFLKIASIFSNIFLKNLILS